MLHCGYLGLLVGVLEVDALLRVAVLQLLYVLLHRLRHHLQLLTRLKCQHADGERDQDAQDYLINNDKEMVNRIRMPRIT